MTASDVSEQRTCTNNIVTFRTFHFTWGQNGYQYWKHDSTGHLMYLEHTFDLLLISLKALQKTIWKCTLNANIYKLDPCNIQKTLEGAYNLYIVSRLLVLRDPIDSNIWRSSLLKASKIFESSLNEVIEPTLKTHQELALSFTSPIFLWLIYREIRQIVVRGQSSC